VRYFSFYIVLYYASRVDVFHIQGIHSTLTISLKVIPTSVLAHFGRCPFRSMPSSVLAHLVLAYFGPYHTHFGPKIWVRSGHGPKWVVTEVGIELWAAILLFPVVGRYRNHLRTLSLNSSWSKTQNCRWNFDAIYHSSRDIITSGLGGHKCYFRLSVVIAITFLNSPWSKTPGCSWKRTHFVVLLLKLVGAFLPPSGTRVRKNRSAIRGLTRRYISLQDGPKRKTLHCRW